MKLIPKLLQGGLYDKFFYVYQPVFAETKAPAKESKLSKTKDESKGKLTEKDLYSMLKDLDGLPNEVNALVRSITNTLLMSTISNTSTSDLSRLYVKILGKIKNAKFNKEQYDAAYKESEKNGSLNDIAITTSGLIVVQTENGGLSTVTPQELLSGEGEYAPVTNSNLLWLRAHDPSFVNNNTIFLIIENGIGLELVHKMIKDRFSKLGSSKVTQERFFPKEAIKGNELLEEAIVNGPDGYYKWKLSLTKTDENLIIAALNYIYDTLPNNAKTRLLLQTQTGTMNEIRDIITQMLISGIDTSVENTFSTIKDSKGKGKGEGEGSGGNTDLSKIPDNTASQWLKGMGANIQYIINPKDTNSYMVYGNSMPLTDHSGNSLPVPTSTLIDVSQGQYGPILDFNNVSIGGRRIDSAALGGVALRDNKIISIDLPCITDDNGNTVPKVDPGTIKIIQEVKLNLKSKGINLDNKDSVKSHYSEISLAFSEKGLPMPYTSDGETILNWSRFGVILVYIDSRIVGDDLAGFDKIGGVKRVTNSATINNLVDAFKDETFNGSRHGFLWLLDPDYIYEGVAYIPVIENSIGVLSTVNLNMGQSQIMDDIQKKLTAEQNRKNNVINGHIPQISQ